jgi:hypothetical protein
MMKGMMMTSFDMNGPDNMCVSLFVGDSDSFWWLCGPDMSLIA